MFKTMNDLRFKFKELGSTYSRRHRQAAEEVESAASTKRVLGVGLLMRNGLASKLVGGALLSGTGSAAEASARLRARGAAVDALIAKSRGGTAAGGMRGAIPKQKAPKRKATKFNTKPGKISSAGKAAASANGKQKAQRVASGWVKPHMARSASGKAYSVKGHFRTYA